GVSSGSAMVGFPPANGVRAIQLLVHHDPRELVWEREAGQTPRPLRVLQHVGRHALPAADRERDLPTVHLPPRRPLGQLPGRPLFSRFRKRDEVRALGHPLEDSRLVLHFPLLDPRVASQPLEVPVTRRAERRVPHAAHRNDTVAHPAYIPRSRCIAATRSTASMSHAMLVLSLCFSTSAMSSWHERGK